MYGGSAIKRIRKKMTKEDRDEKNADDCRGESRPYAEEKKNPTGNLNDRIA